MPNVSNRVFKLTNSSTYSLVGASELDPFGYEYNPLELDARHFGEGIISNLQRNLMEGVV